MSDFTVSGGGRGFSLAIGRGWSLPINIDPAIQHAYLIGNNLRITDGVIDVMNSGGRINLNNSAITNASGNGISNIGVFSGDHLSIEVIGVLGIDNHGAMDLQNTTIQQVAGEAAVENGSEGAGTARFSLIGGLISNNSQVGIFNFSGSVNITSSTISNNRGAGISNRGTMVLENVEVEGNSDAGALSWEGSHLHVLESAFIDNAAGLLLQGTEATLANSTISGNLGDGINVGIGSHLEISYATIAFNLQGLVARSSVSVSNSVVELNSSGNCSDSGSSITLDDANLACDDSLTSADVGLDPLVLEGLTPVTKVHPLLEGSPALDAATGVCLPWDQRRYQRPAGTACDLGAYEANSAPIGSDLMQSTPGSEIPSTIEIITDTPTPGTPTLKIERDFPCYIGPGPEYATLSTLKAGMQLDVVGYGFGGGWLVAVHPTLNKQHCWIDENFVSVSVPVDQLRLISVPPKPTATSAPTQEQATACPSKCP